MTFIELVITFSILIIIISFAFLKIDTSKYAVNSFAKQLASDIRYVRSKNMSGNLNTYIYYEQKESRPYYVLIHDRKFVKEVGLPRKSTLRKTLTRIVFRYDGSLNGLGETIQILHNKKTTEITIVPFSGRVLLKEDIYE